MNCDVNILNISFWQMEEDTENNFEEEQGVT